MTSKQESDSRPNHSTLDLIVGTVAGVAYSHVVLFAQQRPMWLEWFCVGLVFVAAATAGYLGMLCLRNCERDHPDHHTPEYRRCQKLCRYVVLYAGFFILLALSAGLCVALTDWIV